MDSPNRPSRIYYPALDELRGIAIILVILVHNFSFIKLFAFGWIGVDLFFVLSGFLITDILLRTAGSKKWLYHFYLRRFLRIFPLYYFSLLLFLYIIPNVFSIPNISYYLNHQIWFWTYLQNWLYIAKFPRGIPLLTHFWSLAVEEQFYIIWPVLILLLKDLRRLLICILGLFALIIMVRIVLFYSPIDRSVDFIFNSFSRIDGLCVGCLLAILNLLNRQLLVRGFKKVIFLLIGCNLLYLLLRYLLNLPLPYTPFLGAPSVAILFGLIVCYTILHGHIPLLKKSAILTFFGKISYALYIFHWPVYILTSSYLISVFRLAFPNSLFFAQLLAALLCTLFAVIISTISFYTFERFFIKLKNRFI